MIRTILFILLSSIFYVNAFSQSKSIFRIVDLPRTKVDRLDPEPNKNNTIVESDFAQELVDRSNNPVLGNIEKVYYIYTEFAENPGFSQRSLDIKRITELGALYPEVLSNPYVEWKLIAQTGCQSAKEGADFFHGFVLIYRPETSTAQRADELKRMQTFLEDPTKGLTDSQDDFVANKLRQSDATPEMVVDAPANYPDGNFALFNYFQEHLRSGGKVALQKVDKWVSFQFEVAPDGKLGSLKFKDDYEDFLTDEVQHVFDEMPNWTPEMKDGQPIASTVNLDLRICFSPIVKGMYNRDGKKPVFTQSDIEEVSSKQEAAEAEVEDRIAQMEKSAVYRGMESVVPEEKVAVVMDVTSSMLSHIAALNWWVVSSPDSSNIVHYTFFNDGDNLNDKRKKIGETGGIYHGERLHDFTAILMTAMQNGTGGDTEENDLEATLEAINQAPQATSVLLIVDNFSDIRDSELLDQIEKPVHVLISGDVTVVRECYLDIAKKTGGTILVNGQKISLKGLKSGDQISVAQTRYLYDGAHFKML